MAAIQLRDVILGEGRTKIIVPTTAERSNELAEQAVKAAQAGADVVEWRVDYLLEDEELLGALDILADSTPLPILATFRTADEGGKEIDVHDYRDMLLALARSGKVSAIDVEAFRDATAVREIVDGAHNEGVAVVTSYHDFRGTPPAESIASRFSAMDTLGADILKLACMPASVEDLLILLGATREASQTFDRPLITMAMGPIGVVSRIAGAVFGSCATFASVGRASAPGQVPAVELRPFLDALTRWSA